MKLIKRTKLTEENKKLQMDTFYKVDPDYLFKKQLNDKFGLSGWRRSLISKIKVKNKINFLDLGCGLGAYSSLILKENGQNINHGFLIDFSSSSHDFLRKNFSKNPKITLINDHAINALKKLEDKSINYAIIFGFLHEVKDRESLLKLLISKLNKKHIVLFSDNCLYFNAKDVNDDFLKAGFNGICYEKILSFFCFHLFKKISDKDKIYKILFKIGSADSVVGIYRSDIITQNKHSLFHQ